jgi:hypothetical protein
MNIRRIQRARLVAAFAEPSVGRYRSSDTPDCITTRHQDTKGGIGPRRIFTGESRGSGGNLKSSDNWHEEARELTKTARAWSGRFRLSWLFVRFSWPPLRSSSRSSVLSVQSVVKWIGDREPRNGV